MQKRLKVISDIDNTLFNTERFARLARSNAILAMQSAGLPGNFDPLMAKLDGIIKRTTSNYPHHFDDLLVEVGVTDRAERSRIVSEGRAAYHDSKLAMQPYSDVPNALCRLTKKGYELYIASEGLSVQQWEKLIRLKLRHFFSMAFMTEDYGCAKDIAFYELVIKKLGINPWEAVMIGDKPDKDIIPAKSAGLHTIRLLRGPHRGVECKEADYSIENFESLDSIVEEINAAIEKNR